MRAIYQLLKLANDVRAAERAAKTGSFSPITRRIGRRLYGKATGHLARKLFG